MKNEPRFRTLILDEPMQFSVGADTKISSVNVKLEDVTGRDLRKMHESTTKREYAEMFGSRLCFERFENAFGRADKTLLQFNVTHTADDVTCEVWQRGPERRTVELDMEGKS